MTIPEYHARQLAQLTTDEVWNLPDLEHMRLIFDDGVLETSMRETIFSRYTWEIHVLYPQTPFKTSHHIGKRRLGSKTHIDLLSEIVWDCRDAYEQNGVIVDMEQLSEMSYQISNRLYNDMTLRLEEYVATISALDFIDVLDHPGVDAANLGLARHPHPREADITLANDAIKRILFDGAELATNAVAKTVRAGLVSDGQAIQCVGSRGHGSDIDKFIFDHAIVPGFAQGITLLRDHMVESRSASVAALNAKDPMQKSEYMNRNIQLSTATLRNLHHTDCGSRDYVPMTITNKDMLRDVRGMYYLDEETGVERPVRRDTKGLLGKTVKFRSVFTCKHYDRNGFCARCFGELAQSIPAGSNIGHVSAAQLQGPVGQLLLSTKHLLASAKAEPIVISDHDLNYITTGKGENIIYLVPQLAKRRYSLVIAESEAPNLSDINSVPNPDMLIPSRLSELSMIMLVFHDAPESLPVLVEVSTGARRASLSREFLRYVKQQGWSINDNGHYVIGMGEWRHDQPFVELPVKHFSSVDYMLAIASFIKGGDKGQGRSIMKYEHTSAALQAFNDLVSMKLQVPLPYLQAIILSTLVQSRMERDYNLPMPREIGQPAHYQMQMKLRSLSAAMAYQGQFEIMTNPESYLITDRPPHPLDDLLMG